MNLFKKYQISHFKELFGRLGKMPADIIKLDIIAVILSFAAIFQLLGAIVFELPVWADGPALDYSKFSLTWSDEFTDGVFDKAYWSGHYIWGDNATYRRDYAYWNRCMTSFRDGCLIISVDFLEDGPSKPEGPDGPAYFSYGMDTNPNTDGAGKLGFEQLYGYFECRCILPKGEGMNPAFWLLTDGMWHDDTDGGITGCEIDVFETLYKHNIFNRNAIYHTIHIDGYKEAHKKERQGFFFANKPYEKFNTYGFEWNPDGYIFYVNGIESARTDFGGVCTVPLYPILSVGVNELIENNKELPAEFIVDYVRAYQYNDYLS